MDNKKPQTKTPAANPAQKNPQPNKNPQQQSKFPAGQQKKPGSNW
jgi:hypothetical protein